MITSIYREKIALEKISMNLTNCKLTNDFGITFLLTLHVYDHLTDYSHHYDVNRLINIRKIKCFHQLHYLILFALGLNLPNNQITNLSKSVCIASQPVFR